MQDLPGSLVITLLGATLLLSSYSTTLWQQQGLTAFSAKTPVSALANSAK